jgi:hypothetical protein
LALIRWLAVVASLLIAFSGRAMALCPNCLSQSRELSSELRLVGLFLLVPFVVFALAARAIWRASRRETDAGMTADR